MKIDRIIFFVILIIWGYLLQYFMDCYKIRCKRRKNLYSGGPPDGVVRIRIKTTKKWITAYWSGLDRCWKECCRDTTPTGKIFNREDIIDWKRGWLK